MQFPSWTSTNIWFLLEVFNYCYTSAFIKGTEELGFSNFLVKNLKPLPELKDEIYSNLAGNQMLVDITVILKNKPKKINMGDCDDAQLERALELSKKEFGNINIWNRK